MHDELLHQVYEAVGADLYAYIERVCANDADADDLFQESFARLLGSDFAGDNVADSRRYLFRIATNLMRDRFRWSRRWGFTVLPELIGRAPESRYLDEIDAHRALATLKPRQRALLWLAYVEGMTHDEIAATVGVGSKSVRVLLSRARKEILNQLGEHLS